MRRGVSSRASRCGRTTSSVCSRLGPRGARARRCFSLAEKLQSRHGPVNPPCADPRYADRRDLGDPLGVVWRDFSGRVGAKEEGPCGPSSSPGWIDGQDESAERRARTSVHDDLERLGPARAGVAEADERALRDQARGLALGDRACRRCALKLGDLDRRALAFVRWPDVVSVATCGLTCFTICAVWFPADAAAGTASAAAMPRMVAVRFMVCPFPVRSFMNRA